MTLDTSAVVAVRKELNIARLVATARNNIRRQNFEARLHAWE